MLKEQMSDRTHTVLYHAFADRHCAMSCCVDSRGAMLCCHALHFRSPVAVCLHGLGCLLRGLPLQPQHAYTCICCQIVCLKFVRLQADQGGSIDPSVFTDSDGKRWLLFKNDGNAVDQPTCIYLCPLSSDALQVLLYDKALGITDMSLVS